MRIVCLLCFLCFSFFASAENEVRKVSFHTGNFESAMQKAQDEGKLLLVSFYADWCTPCQWMEETSFSDQEVIEIVSEHYVAFRADIDHPEGYAKRTQYEINILPTIMIFDVSGQLIERIEETLSPRSLERLLAKHNKDVNKASVKHPINQSPNQNYTSASDQILGKEESQQLFRIQLGVFAETKNTEIMVSRLKSLFDEPIIVLNDTMDGVVRYKVMIGEFQSLDEASNFKSFLERDYQMKGIVK